MASRVWLVVACALCACAFWQQALHWAPARGTCRASSVWVAGGLVVCHSISIHQTVLLLASLSCYGCVVAMLASGYYAFAAANLTASCVAPEVCVWTWRHSVLHLSPPWCCAMACIGLAHFGFMPALTVLSQLRWALLLFFLLKVAPGVLTGVTVGGCGAGAADWSGAVHGSPGGRQVRRRVVGAPRGASWLPVAG